jgi:hypothetical protein
MKNKKEYQIRDKFFYAVPQLFPNWPYKSRLAIGVNLKDFFGKDDREYNFEVKGTMYSIEASKAKYLGNLYKLPYGIMPNILPLQEFKIVSTEQSLIKKAVHSANSNPMPLFRGMGQAAA